VAAGCPGCQRSRALRNPDGALALAKRAGGLGTSLPMRENLYPNLQGKRILVVEDDVVTAVDYYFQLREVGATPPAYEPTGKAALDFLENHRVDAAIVDYVLRDGPCDAVFRSLERSGIPFVVVSGNTHHTGELERSARVLAKPVAPDELFGALSDLL